MKGKFLLVLVVLFCFTLALGTLTESYPTQFGLQMPAILEDTQVSKSKPAPKPKPSNGGSSNKSRSSSDSKFNSLLGFIVGPMLFFAAFPCIFYNERRAAIETRRINLGKTICEEVDPTNQQQAQTKDNTLVYAKGQTKTNEYISDPISGVGGYNLIKIARKVEVLEWRHKTKKEDNRQQSYYEMEWVTSNSTNEGERYNNPQNWFIQNQTIYNDNVFMGGYKISQQVSELCDKTNNCTPNNQNIQSILHHFNVNDRNASVTGQYIYFTPHLSNNYTPPSFDNYENTGLKQNNSGEVVGTLRVKFELCPTGPMSLLAKSTIQPSKGIFSSYNIAQYQGTHEQVSEIPEGSICCMLCNTYKQFLIPLEQILVVQQKVCTQQQLFEQLAQKSRQFTLAVRLLAYISMVLGICLFFSPIVEILGYIPLVGGFISGIAWFAIVIGALILCIPLFTITLSLAWLIYHPKIGLAILSCGLLLLGYIWMNGQPVVPEPVPT